MKERSISLTRIFGRVLAWLRRTSGLTQRALSELSTLPQAHISRLETGAVTATIHDVILMESCLARCGPLRQPGDLVLLTERIAAELQVRGAVVDLNRGAPASPPVPPEEVEAVVGRVLRSWLAAASATAIEDDGDDGG